jgi:membrane protein implicated in regulation of membrane protease activity
MLARVFEEGRMPWWGWVVIGGVLLGAELLLIDSAFYLVFLGLAAIAVGLLGLAQVSGPPALQWAIFAVLALVLLVGFRRRVYGLVRGADAPGHQALIGDLAVAQEAIGPGRQGRAELHGAVWAARNVGNTALEPGQPARVEGVDGLVIRIRPQE